MSSDLRYGPPRGMRDFYPADMVLRQAIFDAWTGAARLGGFEPYDACVLESLDLLKRKGGEEIVDQIYALKDKSGRDLALRAEMTPTLARMIVARQKELSFPIKWYAIAQCFRYERMSRGRKREHYQWNLDIVGEPSVMAEVEVLSTALLALRRLGLDAGDVRVHVSNRGLLADLFLVSGIPREHHAAIFLALDKRGKIDDNAIADLLRNEGLDQPHIEAAFRLLRLASLEEAAAMLGKETASLTALRDFFRLSHDFGIAEAIQFDIAVIRGLGYYTGIVFEGFDSGRQLRAIFGGGRYDNLLQDIGGQPMTCVGLGFGDVVIGELLMEKGKTPAISEMRDIAVAFMEDAQQSTAIAVAQAWRRKGRCVDLALHAERPKHFFSRMDRQQFREAVFIGPDDVAKGCVRIKDLAQRTEREVPIAELLRA